MTFDLRDVSVVISGLPRPKTLLSHVGFSITPGKLTVIVGPNGAGKSTALGVLAGTRKSSSGSAYLNGRPLESWSPEDQAMRRAVLPQSSTLSFAFRVHEIVAMGRIPFQGRSSAREDLDIIEKAMALTDIDALSERLYPSLSGGEKQRVHMARALAQITGQRPDDDEPRYLLLDEPTSNLDLAHQSMTLKVARRLARDGLGVLAVLHDLNLALSFADHLIVMNHGCIAAQGLPLDVLTPDLVHDVFGVEGQVIPVDAFDGVVFVQGH